MFVVLYSEHHPNVVQFRCDSCRAVNCKIEGTGVPPGWLTIPTMIGPFGYVMRADHICMMCVARIPVNTAESMLDIGAIIEGELDYTLAPSTAV